MIDPGVRSIISNQEDKDDMDDTIRHREILDAIQELKVALEELKKVKSTSRPVNTSRSWY